MSIWLYTEDGTARCEGPFGSITEAIASPLWEIELVCVWIEGHAAGGWYYENVIWTGVHWLTTSKGCRPLPAWRPEVIVDAQPLATAA